MLRIISVMVRPMHVAMGESLVWMGMAVIVPMIVVVMDVIPRTMMMISSVVPVCLSWCCDHC